MAINEAEAHKWFAIECNNQAWDLWGEENLSPEEVSQMIDTAHAAAFHWSHAGTEINKLRALSLLGYVHHRAGHSKLATDYSRQVKGLTAQEPEGITPFDKACTAALAARAADLAGDAEGTATARAQAENVAGTIEEEDDRNYFLNSLLNYAPWQTGEG